MKFPSGIGDKRNMGRKAPVVRLLPGYHRKQFHYIFQDGEMLIWDDEEGKKKYEEAKYQRSAGVSQPKHRYTLTSASVEFEDKERQKYYDPFMEDKTFRLVVNVKER